MPAETPLRFHPEAEDEMNVTADWYDEHTGGGGDFLGALDETVEDIALGPGAGLSSRASRRRRGAA